MTTRTSLEECEALYKPGNDRLWCSDYEGKEEFCRVVGFEFWYGDDHDAILKGLLGTLAAPMRWVMEMRTGLWNGRLYPHTWAWLGKTLEVDEEAAKALFYAGASLLRAEAASRGLTILLPMLASPIQEPYKPKRQGHGKGFARPDQRTRWRILKRDEYICQVCGRSREDGVKLEMDHKLALARGGTNDDDNLWTLCHDCNRGKGVQSL